MLIIESGVEAIFLNSHWKVNISFLIWLKLLAESNSELLFQLGPFSTLLLFVWSSVCQPHAQSSVYCPTLVFINCRVGNRDGVHWLSVCSCSCRVKIPGQWEIGELFKYKNREADRSFFKYFQRKQSDYSLKILSNLKTLRYWVFHKRKLLKFNTAKILL